MTDLLSRATQALRDATQPSPDGAEEMLARLQTGRVHAGSAAQRQRRLRAASIAVAATLVGFGAWAGATGRLPAWSRSLFSSTAPPAPSATALMPIQRRETRRNNPPHAGNPTELGPARAAAEPEHAEAPRLPKPGTRARAAAPRASLNPRPAAPSASASAAPRAPNDVEALYREAHRLHFGDRDFARALELWNRYLAGAGPGARMIVEARFNRAIALAHLGRVDEAILALGPFADGQYGAYRRADARTLIESLERR